MLGDKIVTDDEKSIFDLLRVEYCQIHNTIYGMYLNNMTVGPKTNCFLFLLPELSRIHFKSDHQD